MEGGKPLSLEDARVEDIDRATRALTKKSRAPRSSAERALVDHFAQHKTFKGVHFRVRNGLVNIVGVPAAALTVFANVLRDLGWDEAGPRKKTRAAKKAGARR